MNKFKKFMALGLAAMMVTSLVACGGSTGNAKNKKSDSSKGTTVTFWNSFTGADGDMLVKMVDKFNKENTDGIKVKMDIWIFHQILTASYQQHLQLAKGQQ